MVLETTPSNKSKELEFTILKFDPDLIHKQSGTQRTVGEVREQLRLTAAKVIAVKEKILTIDTTQTVVYPIEVAIGTVRSTLIEMLATELGNTGTYDFSLIRHVKHPATGKVMGIAEYRRLPLAQTFIDSRTKNTWVPAIEVHTNLDTDPFPLAGFGELQKGQSGSRLVYRKLPQLNPPPISQ